MTKFRDEVAAQHITLQIPPNALPDSQHIQHPLVSGSMRNTHASPRRRALAITAILASPGLIPIAMSMRCLPRCVQYEVCGSRPRLCGSMTANVYSTNTNLGFPEFAQKPRSACKKMRFVEAVARSEEIHLLSNAFCSLWEARPNSTAAYAGEFGVTKLDSAAFGTVETKAGAVEVYVRLCMRLNWGRSVQWLRHTERRTSESTPRCSTLCSDKMG